MALYLVGAIALAALVVAIVVAGRRPARALPEMPGIELAPPGVTLLDRFDANPHAGGVPSRSRAYGADLDAGAVAAYYDEQLPPLGYRATDAEPAAEPGDLVVREYARDRLRYRVELAGLPRKVGTKWTTGPWRHILYVTVTQR